MFREHPEFLNLQDDLDKEREQIMAYSRQIGDLNGELNDLHALLHTAYEERDKLKAEVIDLENEITRLLNIFETVGVWIKQYKPPKRSKARLSTEPFEELEKVLAGVAKQ